MVLPGIDTIEATNVDPTFLGHGYYSAGHDLLHDMHALVFHGNPPKRRLGLQQAKTE
jgi:hypothetical protein